MQIQFLYFQLYMVILNEMPKIISFSAVVPEKLTGNPCTSKETCGDCITADPECAWCSEEVRENIFLFNNVYLFLTTSYVNKTICRDSPKQFQEGAAPGLPFG